MGILMSAAVTGIMDIGGNGPKTHFVSGSTETDASNSVTITCPLCTPGDLLCFLVSYKVPTGTTGTFGVEYNNWDYSAQNADDLTNQIMLTCGFKRATPTEPSNFTFSFSPATETAGVVFVIRGIPHHGTLKNVPFSADFSISADTTIDYNSLVTTGRTAVLYFAASFTKQAIGGYTAGLNEIADMDAGSGPATSVAWQLQATGTTTGAKTATVSTGGIWASIAVALRLDALQAVDEIGLDPNTVLLLGNRDIQAEATYPGGPLLGFQTDRFAQMVGVATRRSFTQHSMSVFERGGQATTDAQRRSDTANISMFNWVGTDSLNINAGGNWVTNGFNLSGSPTGQFEHLHYLALRAPALGSFSGFFASQDSGDSGTQVISPGGYGFVPSAILFFITNDTGSGVTQGGSFAIGMSDGVNNGCVGLTVEDNVVLGVTNTSRIHRNDASILGLSQTGVEELNARVTAVGPGSFTLTYTTRPATNRRIMYLVLSGYGSLAPNVVDPGAVGAQSLAFSFNPSVVFFASAGVGSINSLTDGARLGFGFACQDLSQSHMFFGSEHGKGTSSNAYRHYTSAAHYIADDAQGDVNKAVVTAFDVDNKEVDLRWDAASNLRYMYMGYGAPPAPLAAYNYRRRRT
jgi:hypothetical protein